MLCLRNFPVAKNSIDKRGVPRSSVGKFLPYSAKKFRRGTFCAVFQKFSGSEKNYG